MPWGTGADVRQTRRDPRRWSTPVRPGRAACQRMAQDPTTNTTHRLRRTLLRFPPTQSALESRHRGDRYPVMTAASSAPGVRNRRADGGAGRSVQRCIRGREISHLQHHGAHPCVAALGVLFSTVEQHHVASADSRLCLHRCLRPTRGRRGRSTADRSQPRADRLRRLPRTEAGRRVLRRGRSRGGLLTCRETRMSRRARAWIRVRTRPASAQCASWNSHLRPTSAPISRSPVALGAPPLGRYPTSSALACRDASPTERRHGMLGR